jgi:hypothetical protein
MAKKKDDKEVMTVVAELRITSLLGEETIRSFDKAWTRFRELPTPTNCCLLGFVRKTDAELAEG